MGNYRMVVSFLAALSAPESRAFAPSFPLGTDWQPSSQQQQRAPRRRRSQISKSIRTHLHVLAPPEIESSFVPTLAAEAPSSAWRSLDEQKAFATPVFPKEQPLRLATNVTGFELLLPDFEVLFSRIAQISPLSKQILEGNELEGFDNLPKDTLNWKIVEKKSNRLVHEIDVINNFEGLHTPLIRMRSKLEGPEGQNWGDQFSRLLTDREFRVKWDPNCKEIYEVFLAEDIADVNLVQEGRFGNATKFGLGYCRTKKNVVSPREQLTLCGLQEFPSGASIVWGVELEDDQNHLFPPGERLIRSRSHIFSNAIVPTGPNTFDCEYTLALEIGGFPEWLARPVLVTICKDLFRYAEKYYAEKS